MQITVKMARFDYGYCRWQVLHTAAYMAKETVSYQIPQNDWYYGFMKIFPDLSIQKLFSCSTQMSMKFFLLINVEIPTVVGISIFMGRKIAFLAYISLKIDEFLDIFVLMSI